MIAMSESISNNIGPNVEQTTLNKSENRQVEPVSGREGDSTGGAQSSSSNSSASTIKHQSATSTGKFKEKPRPEPLDLSVKSDVLRMPRSAGLLGGYFNLGSANQMSTLETPRIFWQDNESLLIKSRLYSSSTSTSISHRIHQSSLCGESPPMTPSTPLGTVDMIYSPGHPLSSSSLHAFMSAQLQYTTRHQEQYHLYQQHHLDEDQLKGGANRFLAQQHLRNNKSAIKSARRSCSSESLNSTSRTLKTRVSQDSSQVVGKGRKSPLESNRAESAKIHGSFSYSGHQVDHDNRNSRVEQHSDDIQAHTPTSVTNATANLHNIHLNSPTSLVMTGQPGFMSSLNDLLAGGGSGKSDVLDPLLSAAYYQSLRSSSSQPSSSSSDLNLDKHNFMPSYLQHCAPSSASNGANSHAGSTSLNTPTLISPSQLKNGSLCFLPSPTLSPMSSVFELPSPLLMFPPPSSKQQTSSPKIFEESGIKKEPMMSKSQTSVSSPKSTPMESNTLGVCDTEPKAALVDVEHQLAQLVTPARDKVGEAVANEEIEAMDINLVERLPAAVPDLVPTQQQADIPKILVSDCLLQQSSGQPNAQSCPQFVPPLSSVYTQQLAQSISVPPPQQRNQRDVSDKRALSPQSFRARVSHYHNERLESCSAPPDVCATRARSKIKSVTEEPEPLEPAIEEYHGKAISGQQYRMSAPYPESSARGWLPVGSSRQNSLSWTPADTGGEQNQFEQPMQVNQPVTCSGYSLSHSTQHLQSGGGGDGLTALDTMRNLNIQQQQQHCHSAEDLYRSHQYPTGTAGAQQMIRSPTASVTQVATSLSLHQNHNQLPSSMSELDSLLLQHHHSLVPGTQIRGPSFPAGPLQADPMLHNQPSSSETHQRHPRAMSADDNGLLLARPTCDSPDFGAFRSSSAASSAPTAKKYHCDQCAKSFSRSDMLTRHKRLHSGDRPFQCNECKQGFSRSDHLSTHMRTHTGEKPYKCKLCAYSACRKDMITRHMKVHNRSSPNGLEHMR